MTHSFGGDIRWKISADAVSERQRDLWASESTLFINSQVNMLLWPKAAAHFHMDKESGLPVAKTSPACEIGSSPWKYCIIFFFFCSVLCLFLSVYRHEDFDCLSTSPLGSFSPCPTFSPPLFTYVVVFFFLPSALSLFLPVNICLTQTLSFSFDVLVLLFTYCFVWSTRRRLFLWKSWKAQREHINNLL